MSIINRDKHPSEQQIPLKTTLATVSGASSCLFTVPFRSSFVAATEAAFGLSGTPISTLVVERFLSGVGATVIGGWFATLTSRSFSASGPQGFSATGQGATFPLLAGDVITLFPSGTNAAVARCNIQVVLQALDDYRNLFTGF